MGTSNIQGGGTLQFGMSGKEIIALEEEIKQLKAKVYQKDKELAGLQTEKIELKSQLDQ
jgi:hypothetical protein